jgi:uncharacterized membrane protein HdeD (DUF308 family)
MREIRYYFNMNSKYKPLVKLAIVGAAVSFVVGAFAHFLAEKAGFQPNGWWPLLSGVVAAPIGFWLAIGILKKPTDDK